MMITALVLLALAGEAKVTVETPSYYVAGMGFPVRILVEGATEGGSIEGWKLTAAGFSVGGKALAEKGSEPSFEVGPAEKKTLEVDLGAVLKPSGDFELQWGDQPARKVHVLERAPADVKFMDEAAVPAAELAKYWVLLRTNRGDILVEFWPDVAPNHVRNFLDLSSTGFYDGVTFHRVIPGFMIQGGDPNGTGTGGGPRRLKAEFNSRKHERGVLSMARSQDPNSASCQFFIMHQNSPHLDNQYSAFGRVVTGMDAVDRIVNTPRGANDRPNTPQVILKATVVKAGDAMVLEGKQEAK